MTIAFVTLKNLASLRFSVAIVVVFFLALSSEASAQCSLGKGAQDVSQVDHFGLQAATTNTNCGNREIWVEAWLSGQSTYCDVPSNKVGSLCKKVKTDGTNAVVTAYADNCGPGTGKSNHKAWDPYVAIAIEEITGLLARCYDPAEACAEMGPDYYWDGDSCEYTPGSPIVISTERNHKYAFTSPKDGVLFDIDADGVLDQVAWTLPDSDVAFLAIDRNGDGIINDGKELFGNHTYPGARNGFQALSLMAMASNGGVRRGEVSADDPLYAQLLLWTDNNHNGISERWELQPASNLLAEVGMSYKPMKTSDEFGNLFAYRGWALLRTSPGRNAAHTAKDDAARTVHIWDVYLKIE